MSESIQTQQRTPVKELLASDSPRSGVTVKGWVRTIRKGKEVSFIALNDGSCFASLQLVLGEDVDGFGPETHVGTGSAVAAFGDLVESPAEGQAMEFQVRKLEIVGDADSEYPLQKKRHSFEFMRTIAHLRPRANAFGAVFRVRSALTFAIHKFFQERGFVNAHTPIITANDCEGAGELFQVTSLALENPPKVDGKVDYSQDFFGERTGLTVSGQLEAEIFATTFSDVYTFGPTFRAENSNTSRHAAEFWMIEPEIAFADLKDNAQLAEDMLRYLLKYALEECAEDMAFFNQRIEKGLIDRLQAIVEGPFHTMTYTDAVAELQKAKVDFEFPVGWGQDLQSEHERYLTEQVLDGPVFVVDYPKTIKPFYMRLNDDDKTVAAMDLLVPRVGELIGGSQREERMDVLVSRMKEQGLDPASLQWYVDLRRWGSCPHAGYGLGFERLLMYVTGMENIRDVIPFPRTPGNAKF